mgnify:CR=1 FL=1
MANMEDALTTYKHIDLVVGTSAQHSLGAYGACESAGRNEMFILSMDGEDEEMEMIDRKDIFLLTVTQDPAGMSRTIAGNIADQLANGTKFAAFQSAPSGVYAQEGTFTLDQVKNM